MRSLIIAGGLWGIVAVICGVLGHQLLRVAWQADAELRFVRDLQLVSQFMATQYVSEPWGSTWEGDPVWQDLERRFDLDVVPIRPAKQSAAQATDKPVCIWSRSPAGKYRLATEIWFPAVADSVASNGTLPPDSSRIILQATRELSGSQSISMWWWAWSVTNLLGCLFAAFAIFGWRKQKNLLRGLLAPWLTALRSPTPEADVLPPIDTESELEPALQVVSEIVNRWFSELRSANERSELVLSNLQEGVLAVNQRSQVLLANHALRRLLDISEEELVDLPLVEVIRLPLVNELAASVLSERLPQERLLELSGPNRHLRVRGRPLPLGNRGMGALLTVRDETMLRRIEAIRRDFVANASHELKTPLAAIRAYAETLQLGALEDRPMAEQFVGRIVEQADRINGLVQGMLQLSRVEAGTALKMTRFDACAAAEPCVAAARAMAHAKNVQLHEQLPDQPLVILSDRDAFQTIASNLLSNAVRYTPEGGCVTVQLQQAEDKFVLRVSDTGIGIQTEDLERIFERFYRAEKDRSSESGGTGLGLSIVKHLTIALGGSVMANSRLGKGSCFEVALPIVQDAKNSTVI